VDFLWKNNPKVPVFIPTFELTNHWPGRKPVVVDDHKKLAKNIGLVRNSASDFDPFGGKMHELTLVLQTKQGLVLVVGCSHPGLEKIIKRVQSIFPGEIYLVTGGFHYIDFSTEEIEKKVKALKKLGVKKVGPSHCSGPIAEEIFYKYYKDNYYLSRLKDTIPLPPPLHNNQNLK
jgi:7,8-dihydropterin-6-yl-methyl-4-(beta-D-ribofuranosyl)aminobenzene 5'-phosphate synthase